MVDTEMNGACFQTLKGSQPIGKKDMEKGGLKLNKDQ